MVAAILWLVTLPVVFLFSIFLIEILFGLIPRRLHDFPQGNAATVIIVPAHNEADGIARTLGALIAELPSGARILVVADNCDDETASIARMAGVDVIEREDSARRGKGFALSFARDHLLAAPPACVVVIDADCLPSPGSIGKLRDAVAAWNAPVQARSVLEAGERPVPMVQISNFAYLIKTYVRQRGAALIGGPALLGGTGMALPWSIFAAAPLASGDLVEDLSLGVFAVRSGHAPRFVESARVTSHAAAQSSTFTQRTRWEHGFIASMRRYALPLILSGLRRLRWPEIWLGLHLCVPPLALLAAIGAVVLAVAAIGGWLAGVLAPAIVLAAVMSASAVGILIAWAAYGRGVLAAGALVRLPFYVLWKLPIYFKLIRKPETSWIRTSRRHD